MSSRIDEVEDSDQDQEAARDQRADRAADASELRRCLPTTPCTIALDRQAEGDRDQQHHGRVAEREEEAHADRLLALLQQLARGVVDGRDVVGVEGVAQPEGVGEAAEPEKGGVARRRTSAAVPSPTRWSRATPPKNPASLRRSPRSNDLADAPPHQHPTSLSLIATRSQLRFGSGCDGRRSTRRAVASAMDLDRLPPQIRTVLRRAGAGGQRSRACHPGAHPSAAGAASPPHQ